MVIQAVKELIIAYRTPSDTPLQLCYDQPAEQWVAALPVGNGKLGAMIYGGVPTEHIQFNEDSVWKGKPHSYTHAAAHANFPAPPAEGACASSQRSPRRPPYDATSKASACRLSHP